MAETRYKLIVSEDAREQLRSLPKDRRQQIGERLNALQHGFEGDVKKLHGAEGKYRLRVGRYRVLFRLEKDMIVIYAVKDRKEAYE
jgi:mRNA interferase RelE/StbE